MIDNDNCYSALDLLGVLKNMLLQFLPYSKSEGSEPGVPRTVGPKSLYSLSPKGCNDFCVATHFVSKNTLVSAGLQTQFT